MQYPARNDEGQRREVGKLNGASSTREVGPKPATSSIDRRDADPEAQNPGSIVKSPRCKAEAIEAGEVRAESCPLPVGNQPTSEHIR